MSSIQVSRIRVRVPDRASVERIKAQILATRGNDSDGSPAVLRATRLPGHVKALLASGGRKRVVVNDRRRNVAELHE